MRPLCLAYFGPVWLLSAWCELRDDFRTFRLDRIDGFAVQADRFRLEAGKTLHDFLKRDQTWTRGYGGTLPIRERGCGAHELQQSATNSPH